jgi:tRNA(Ile)-lysidine synthase TilS/MesJ/sulfur carrier protein ThiS
MARAVIYNKVGEAEPLEVRPGQTIRDVLRAHGIPTNTVLTTVNGRIVSEDIAVVEPDDYVEVRQTRHYDLDVTRDPVRRVYGAPNPIYTKSVLFDHGGEVEVRSEQFDGPGYVDYVEQTFVEGVEQAGLFEPDDHVVTGLSGGRDSVSFLKLLERTQGRLPDFEMTAVTVTGLPDWEEPETFGAATRACESLGVEHVVVEPEEIQDAFRLADPYVEVMNRVVGSGATSPLTMVLTHQVMRRMVEVEAERRGARTVALGLNSDDLVATLVTWFTSGFRMGPIPVRSVGPFRYVFPLYRITKKELTLYLELVSPELNRQGAPGRFTTGPGERSLAYSVADHLYDLWPGIDYYLFEAFANVQRQMMPAAEQECRVCGGTYLNQEGTSNPARLCDVCAFFATQELSTVR